MGRSARIKQWPVCISSQGKDIEQKDQVEKGNLRCTRPCMIEKNYFF